MLVHGHDGGQDDGDEILDVEAAAAISFASLAPDRVEGIIPQAPEDEFKIIRIFLSKHAANGYI